MSDCSEYVLADDVPRPRTDDRTRAGERDDALDTLPDGEPTVADVLQVVLDVGTGERETYLALSRLEPCSAGDLAEELDRDRSNVNRYLNRLSRKGLATRRRRILQSGGHVYEYSTRSPDRLRELLLAGLREWIDGAQDCIDELVVETAERTDRDPTRGR